MTTNAPQPSPPPQETEAQARLRKDSQTISTTAGLFVCSFFVGFLVSLHTAANLIIALALIVAALAASFPRPAW